MPHHRTLLLGGGWGTAAVGSTTFQAVQSPQNLPGPGRVQDSGPSDRRCCGGRAPLSWPGWETGHLLSLTSQGERPRPRYLPGAGTFPSSPPQLLQGIVPPLGWGSQGLPLPFTACWVLPTCPHVGALWPEAQVSGQCQNAQLPHFCTAVPLLPPLEAGGRPEAEVGLASHATSLPETLRLPSTATFTVSPSNPCHPPGDPPGHLPATSVPGPETPRSFPTVCTSHICWRIPLPPAHEEAQGEQDVSAPHSWAPSGLLGRDALSTSEPGRRPYTPGSGLLAWGPGGLLIPPSLNVLICKVGL